MSDAFVPEYLAFVIVGSLVHWDPVQVEPLEGENTASTLKEVDVEEIILCWCLRDLGNEGISQTFTFVPHSDHDLIIIEREHQWEKKSGFKLGFSLSKKCSCALRETICPN